MSLSKYSVRSLSQRLPAISLAAITGLLAAVPLGHVLNAANTLPLFSGWALVVSAVLLIIAACLLSKALRRSERRARRLEAYLSTSPDAIFAVREGGTALDTIRLPVAFPGAGDHGSRKYLYRSLLKQYRAALDSEPESVSLGVERCFELKLDGQNVWMELRVLRNDVCDSDVLLVRNVTREQASRRTIEYLATHDVLTRLPNRYLFNQHLVQALKLAKRHGRTVMLGFVDLNDFKRVNDTLGHAAGDEVLVETARRLSTGLREADLVARISGDEFVFVLNDVTDIDAATMRVRQVIDVLNTPIFLKAAPDMPQRISAALGIALYPTDGTEAEDLLAAADKAMYADKARRKALATTLFASPVNP